MKKNTRSLNQGLIFAGLITLLVASGCSSSKPKPDTEEAAPAPVAAVEAADENPTGDSDSGKAGGLQTVHFPFDSSTMDAEAKRILEANASVLKEKPSYKVQIEGHCDQRGGIQYNIALGEKRANAARRYLEGLGVTSDRMTVVSMGKEHPLDASMTDDAYAKNRRGNFVITTH
jgi:peptidoglycan-associated lipoprotein